MEQSTALLDASLNDDLKPLVKAEAPTGTPIYLHANQILQGFGKGKQMITASYTPQSGIAGNISNAQFDILIPPTTSDGGIAVIDQIFLQIDINLKSNASVNCALKPVQQWLNRVDISMDGSSNIQSIYFDKQFIDTFNNMQLSNLDDIKAQMNLDPRNGLCWFDKQAKGSVLDLNAGGAIVSSDGLLGQSAYLSQPYFKSQGAQTGAVGTAGELASFIPFAKGGMLSNNGTTSGNYTFYIPITNTVLQSAKILMNKLTANVRFRFYMNNEVKLFDQGFGVNATQVTINQATLWTVGSKLSLDTLNLLDAQYALPVVSAYNYYLEFTQDFSIASGNNSFNTATLSPLTGLCSQLTFWLEDIRQDIAYPAANGGGDKYIQNNMMTVPVANYQLVDQQGQIVGSGLPVPNNLALMMNSFYKFPKNVSQDDRLYFRKYYYIDFANSPITAENSAVYGSQFYQLTGREQLKFTILDKTLFPAADFPNKELNGEGNAVTSNPVTPFYNNVRLHVCATIYAEAIEQDGLIKFTIPRI